MVEYATIYLWEHAKAYAEPNAVGLYRLGVDANNGTGDL